MGVLPYMRKPIGQRELGIIAGKDKTMVRQSIGVLGIALGIATATEVTAIPFIFMGIGFLALMGVTE